MEQNAFFMNLDKGSNVTILLPQKNKNTDTIIVIGRRHEGRSQNTSLADSCDTYMAKFLKNEFIPSSYRRFTKPEKYEAILDVIQTSDGGYAMTGWAFVQNEKNHLLIMKVDSNFNEVFYKLVPPAPNNWYGGGIVEAENGNLIVVGYRAYDSLRGFGFIHKYTSSGNLIWQKELVPPVNELAGKYSLFNVISVSPNHYLASGYKRYNYNPPFFGYRQNRLLIKFDANGNILWTKEYDGYSYMDSIDSRSSGWVRIKPSPDGNYLLCGWEQEETPIPNTSFYDQYGVISKVKPDGSLIWTRKYTVQKKGKTNDGFNDILPTSDGGILVVGDTYADDNDSTHQNIWVMKLDSLGCDKPGCDPTISVVDLPVGESSPIQIFPNPTVGKFTIEATDNGKIEKVRVYDTKGMEINKGIIYNGSTLQVDIYDAHSGNYILVFQINGVVFARSIVKI